MSDYAFVHNGKAYTPNQTPVAAEEADAHNAKLHAEELAQWAEKPERQVAYYRFIGHEQRENKRYESTFYPSLVGASVSTWMGHRLGTIIEARVYPHNFGGRFVSMTVQGSNGAVYYGRASWDWGTVIRLRKRK